MKQSGPETNGRELGTQVRLDNVTTFPGTPDAPPRSLAALGRHRAPSKALPVARRAQITSPVLQGLIALATYAAALLPTKLDLLLAHPSVAQLDMRGYDPDFFVWILRWWPYAIAHGLNPLHTSLISAPGASELAWTSSVPTLAVLATPLTEAAGPVAAYNLLTVLAIPLTAWAAFLFCRRLTGRFWPSLVGGAVFGFSGYEFSFLPIGDLDLTYTLILPVLGYLVVLWWQDAIGRVMFVVLTGLALGAQFYLFLEISADLTALLGVSLVVGYALAGRTFRPKVARLAGLLSAGYGLALVLAAPYLYAALESIPIVNFHGKPLDVANLETDFPLFAVAIALVLTRWSSRLTRHLAVMLIIIIPAALGPTLRFDGRQYFGLPWGGIWNLPFLRDAYPNRLTAFAYLVLAVMTALFLAESAGSIREHGWRWLLAVPIAGVMVCNMTVVTSASISAGSHNEVPAFISSGQYRRALSRGETVAVISEVRNAGMLWQAQTDFYFRLAGGYVGFQFSRYEGDLPAPVQHLADNSVRTTPRLVSAFKKYVVRARLGAILVQVRYKPKWVKFLSAIGLRGRVIGGVLVYPVDNCRACVNPLHRHRRQNHRRLRAQQAPLRPGDARHRPGGNPVRVLSLADTLT